MHRFRPAPPRPWTPPSGRPARILIVRLSALGDVIHALPVLAALRALLPDAEIDWAVEDRAAELLQARSDLDRIVVFPRRELATGGLGASPRMRRATGFLREIRARRYDLALDLQGNLKSGVITRASGAHIRFGLDRRVAREGNHLFTNRRALPGAAARHRVDRNLALLGALLGHGVAWRDPGLALSPPAAERARAALDAAGVDEHAFVLLHPGTSAFGAYKRWPTEHFADLARRLEADGRQVAVTVPPGEEALADAVALRTGPSLRRLPTGGLQVLGEVVRRARLLVAADTGPLHLAALASTPVLGLFGPKDAAVYGPYGRRADGSVGPLEVLSRPDVACRPCPYRTCADPVCMTGLLPDTVYEAVRRILESQKGAPARSPGLTPPAAHPA